MIMYQQDPDVVRWGLDKLFDICTISKVGSCSTVTQYQTDPSHIEVVREGYCEVEHVNVENDEIIAHTLQEELSRVAAAEASGSSHIEEGNLQASILSQDWTGPLKRNLNCGHESVPEDGDGEKSQSGVDLGTLLEINDEYVLDGEVGKRLHQMVPIPHVPKINGEIPSVDEETTDHQRLLDRLQLYDLIEFKVEGDGNCQFRSLSDQFYRTPSHHRFVRQQVINQLKSHPEMYEGYVPMAYGDYLKKMSKSGEWGDHVTLQAAADSYGVKVFVLTSFKDTCYIEILPHIQKSKRIIFLSFWAEVHYNSIYPLGDLPELESRKKKKWWIF